jgi:tubulin delta
LHQRRSWHYDKRNAFWQQGGAANNWALGYNVLAPQCESAVLDSVRRELEAMDLCGGVMVMHSVAGGTGSGVGSYLCEALRDAIDPPALLSTTVWPFEAGDVSVQAFNAALTLTHVAAAADGVIVLDNDGAHAVCQRALRIARPGFEDLNRFMARSLAALLLPSAVVRGGGDADVRAMALLAEPAQHLFSRPSLRLAAARVIPQMPLESRAYSTHTWEALSRLLCDMTAAAATCEVVVPAAPRPARCAALWAVARGPDAVSAAGGISERLQRDRRLIAPGLPDSVFVSASSRPFGGYDKTLASVAVSSGLASPLQRMARSARVMLQADAFVHSYVKHGVAAAELEEAVLRLDAMAAAHGALAGPM